MTFFRHFQNNSCISPVIYHHFLPIDHFQAFKCNVSPQGALGQNPKPTSTGGVKNPKFRKIYTTLIILSSSKEGGRKLHCQLRWGDMVGLAPYIDPHAFSFENTKRTKNGPCRIK